MAPSARPSQIAPTGQSPLIGREKLLVDFNNRLAALGQGRGGLITVEGQAGVGKTRLAETFRQTAKDLGNQTIWISCSKTAEQPAFWPIIKCLKAEPFAKIEAAAAALKAIAQSDADQPIKAASGLLDPHLDALQSVASETPLAVFIDGAEALDPGTLRLLDLLDPHISNLPVLIILVGRSAAPNGRLLSVPYDRRIVLDGLSTDQTGELVNALSQLDPPRPYLQRLHQLTGGNPFFITEIVGYLLETGQLNAQDEHYWPTAVLVPDTIRSEFHHQLQQVSDTCLDVLSLASVIGLGFDYVLLSALARKQGREDDLSALEEAEAARLIELDLDGPGLFRFAHVLLRETLYDDLSTTRRLRLHGDYAEALIEYFGVPSEPEDLAVLAQHLVDSRRASAIDRVVAFADEGAAAASRKSDFEQETQFLRIALDAIENSRRKPDRQAIELAIRLTEAQTRSGDFLEAIETGQMAWHWNELIADPDLFAKAALAVNEARWRPGRHGETALPMLKSAIERLPPGDSGPRAQLLCAMGQALASDLDKGNGAKMALEGLAMARRLGNPDLMVELLGTTNMALRHDPSQRKAMTQNTREFVSLAMAGNDPQLQVYAQSGLCITLAENGEGAELRTAVERFETLAHLGGSPHEFYQVALHKFNLALIAGRFSDAPGLAAAAREAGVRLNGADSEGVFGMQMFALNRELGRLGQLAPLLKALADSGAEAPVWRPGLALLFAEIGESEAALRLLEELAGNGFALIPRDDLWLVSLAFLADVRLLEPNGDQFVRELIAELQPYREYMILIRPGAACFGPVTRLLGGLQNLIGNYDLARIAFEEALKHAERMDSPPMSLRCRCDYIEALIREGTPSAIKRADQLLNDLEPEATRLGMQGLRERAIRLSDMRRDMAATFGIDELTPRELEVLRLIAKGMTNSDISSRLKVSRPTVATHVRNILAKTNCPNRTAAVAFARQANILK